MLDKNIEFTHKEQELIKNEISNVINDIKNVIEDGRIISKNNKEFLEYAANTTANMLAPKTKMFLNSAYYILSEKTLKIDFFKETSNQYQFNKRNILKDLENKFDFSTPKAINFKEQNKLLATSSILLIGGGASLISSSVYPISVAVVVSALAYILLKEIDNKKVNTLLIEYLKNVEESLNKWIKDIEIYYIEEVIKLKESLSKNNE